MKLIVQIPCFNEADTLAAAVRDIPRAIEGIDKIEILIIDDGSGDRTVAVARELGVDHIVRHAGNRGLARAFRTGLAACLARGADIIVNTDGDNQYAGADIATLVRPILAGEADIVVGDRGGLDNPHFGPFKKRLQVFGSAVVRRLSGLNIPDAVSGFRALSREAAGEIHIVSDFSYTIEMLIQAGAKRLAVTSVPVGTNGKTRNSRLFKSIPHFLRMSGMTIGRIYTMYRPLKVFVLIGAIPIALGTLPILRFLFLYAMGDGAGHLQSLVLGGTLVIVGVMTMMFGLIADLISSNRKLMEIALGRLSRLEAHLDLQHQKKSPDFGKVERELAEMARKMAG